MKDTYYFQHDYNAANDQKVLKLRAKFNNAEGYGIYFMILEAMAQEKTGRLDNDCIAQLSLSYGLAIEQLKAVLNYCLEIGLFVQDENGIFSKRMLEHKNFRKERSLSGKKGAKTRWKNSSAIAQPLAQLMQRKGKERKGNNIKQAKYKDGFVKWLEAYNLKFNSSYKSLAPVNNFTYWINQGYSVEDMIKALENLPDHDWLKDKHTPALVLKRRDTKGNPVDRFGELLSIKVKRAL